MCCISNARDDIDDNISWNDGEEDGNVRNECEEDEGTKCEDGDNDINW